MLGKGFQISLLFASLALIGCDPFVVVPGSNTNSAILSSLGDFDDVDDYDAILRHAAFSKLKGKTKQEAVTFLTEDGFTCIGSVCETYITRRELFRTGFAPPGPLRIITLRYKLAVHRAVVNSLSAVDASVTSETSTGG